MPSTTWPSSMDHGPLAAAPSSEPTAATASSVSAVRFTP